MTWELCINRTIVELKQFQLHLFRCYSVRINRTIVELKLFILI